ncbi:hypothetical protein FOE78_17585 [Microlunatus elymi]|uniref:Multicomponent Na+:H+ antiporter subunit G n=1 Tax=Microlunatus elymi TaxID=2596828 RepID=A0A516Q229_9ACTN|nr:hypothetical protein [Microlunatus elymi]QDP97483.1 hypothetical protein FOE78_17585 [Microlunatus elymi]
MQTVITILIVLALAAAALTGLGVLLARTPLDRLHFLAPLGTLGVLLFAAAAVLMTGPTLSSVLIGLTAVITAVSSSVLVVAVGRALADEAGIDVGESPE